MKVGFKNVPKFQEGGAMPPQDPAMAGGAPEEMGGAPAPEEAGAEQGGDPLMQLAQMAMQALQSQDCNAAMQVCEGFVQLIQQAQGGAEGGAPAPEAQGEPVYRRGGTLVRRIKK